MVSERGGKSYAKEIMILRPKQLKAIANERSIQILKLLAKRAMYPAEIAKKLKLYPQKVYYHVRRLERAGFLKVVGEKKIKGGTAKLYALKCGAFGVEMNGEEEEIGKVKVMDEKLLRFFGPLIERRRLNGLIVVGSPLPHGPFRTGARDGHYSAQLALFLGQFLDHDNFCVRLDVDVKAEGLLRENLILIGGPGVNSVSYEINRKLPYFFNIKSSKYGYLLGGIVSRRTGETYNEDLIGVVERIRNPWDKRKVIVLIAGNKAVGTKAGILGLTKFYKELLKGFKGEEEWGVLIRGLDVDGDGKVDQIEVVE